MSGRDGGPLCSRYIILYFLGGRLADSFPAGAYATSVISELELLAYPGLVSSEEQRIRDFLADVPVTDLTQAPRSESSETIRAETS